MLHEFGGNIGFSGLPGTTVTLANASLRRKLRASGSTSSAYVSLFLSASLFAVAAIGQTIQSPSLNPSSGQTPQADQTTINSSIANSNPSSTELSPVVVIGQLNEARDQIVPYLGATRYSIGQEQIQTQSQGSNAPFNQVILRMPGVAEDSYGQLHV